MRGVIIKQLAAVVLVVAASVVFVLMVSQPARSQVARFMTGNSCGNGVCDSTLEHTICPDDCPPPPEFDFTFEHLLYNSADLDTLSKADAKSYIISTDYFIRTGGAWAGSEGCTNCNTCNECEDYLDFEKGQDCSDCEECEYNDTTKKLDCGDCLHCAQAKSDSVADTYTYKDCLECWNCSSCTAPEKIDGVVTPPEGITNCTSCSFCGGCLDSSAATKALTYPKCGYCFWCEGNKVTCHSCGDCNSTLPSDYAPEKYTETNRCWNCSSCTSNCQAGEPGICQRLKDCIANYDGRPCEIESVLSTREKLTWLELRTNIEDALKHCREETVMTDLAEGMQQKVCQFKTPSGINLVGADTEMNPLDSEQFRTFNECGAKGVFWESDGSFLNYVGDSFQYQNLFINTYAFISSTQPPGWHYKIMLGGMNNSVGADNICRYNIFVCGVQPQATDFSDKILEVHGNILKKLLDFTNYPTPIDISGSNNKWFHLTADNVNMPVGSKLCSGGKDCDIAQISNMIMVALQDWQAVAREDRDIIETICKKIKSDERCGAVVQMMMDSTKSWNKASGIPGYMPDEYPPGTYTDGPTSRDIHYIAQSVAKLKVNLWLYAKMIVDGTDCGSSDEKWRYTDSDGDHCYKSQPRIVITPIATIDWVA